MLASNLVLKANASIFVFLLMVVLIYEVQLFSMFVAFAIMVANIYFMLASYLKK